MPSKYGSRILLLGPTGQVGYELHCALSPGFQVVPAGRTEAPGQPTLDLTDPDSIRARVREVEPDIIVNAAAHTAVDQAEDEPEIAQAVNGDAPALLADEASRRGALLVHYSTDYVFDGTASEPYTEDSRPAPLNVYGRTKRVGEEAILASGCDALILRTSWVYGLRGRNFLMTMRRLLAERDSLQVIADQIGAPTWSRLIAEATVQILSAGELPDQTGLYHLTASGQTSWHGFTEAIRDELGEACVVEPIPSEAYPTKAARPGYSVLDCSRLRQRFGIRMPDWREGLRLCLSGRDG